MKLSSTAFLIGVPRSGTTLLSVLLNQHPELYCPTEPWLLLALDHFGKIPPSAACGAHLLRDALYDFIPADDGFELMREWAQLAYQKQLNRVDRRVFIDKTPRYYLILDRLFRWFPDAPMVVLVRNPLDVATSMVSTWNVDLAGVIRRQQDHRLAIDYCVGHARLAKLLADPSPNIVVVRYEQLVRDPASAMEPVWRAIGVAAIPLVVESFDLSSNPALSGRMGDPKIRATSNVHQNSCGRWRTELTDDDAKTFAEALGSDVFEMLGYGDDYRSVTSATGGLMETCYVNFLARREREVELGDDEVVIGAITDLRKKIDNGDAQIQRLELSLAALRDSAEASRVEIAALRAQMTWKESLPIGMRVRDLARRWARKTLTGVPTTPIPQVGSEKVTVLILGGGMSEIISTIASLRQQGSVQILVGLEADLDGLPDSIANRGLFSNPGKAVVELLGNSEISRDGWLLVVCGGDYVLPGTIQTLRQTRPRTAALALPLLEKISNWIVAHPRHLRHSVRQQSVDAIEARGWAVPMMVAQCVLAEMNRLDCGLDDSGFYWHWLLQIFRLAEPEILTAGGVIAANRADFPGDARWANDFGLAGQLVGHAAFRASTGFFGRIRRWMRVQSIPRRRIQGAPVTAAWQAPAAYSLVVDSSRDLFGNPLPPACPIDGRSVSEFLISSGAHGTGMAVVTTWWLNQHGNTACAEQSSVCKEMDVQLMSAASPVSGAVKAVALMILPAPLRFQLGFFAAYARSGREVVISQHVGDLMKGFQSNGVSSLRLRPRLLMLDCHDLDALSRIKSNEWDIAASGPRPESIPEGITWYDGDAWDAVHSVPAGWDPDVILLGKSLECWGDPGALLRRLALVLRPGGSLIVATPNLDSLLRQRLGSAWWLWGASGRKYIFNRRAMVELACSAGLLFRDDITVSDPVDVARSLALAGGGPSTVLPEEWRPVGEDERAARAVAGWLRLRADPCGKGDWLIARMVREVVS